MVDSCMMGVRNIAMLEENPAEIDKGPLNTKRLDTMRRIGDNHRGRSQ